MVLHEIGRGVPFCVFRSLQLASYQWYGGGTSLEIFDDCARSVTGVKEIEYIEEKTLVVFASEFTLE